MQLGVCAAVIGWLAVLCVYDVRQRRLPNRLTLPGAAAFVAFAFAAGHGLPAVAGAGALAVLYLLVHLASPAAMGAGDVKLALGVVAVTGFFGVAVWLLAALAAPLLTSVWAVCAWARRGGRQCPPVPHGPSMCIATVAAAALALV